MKIFTLKYFFILSIIVNITTLNADDSQCNQFKNQDFENSRQYWDMFSDSVRRSYTSHSGEMALVYKDGGFGQDMDDLPNIDGHTKYILQGYYKNYHHPDSIWLGIVYFDEDWEFLKEDEIELSYTSSYKKFSIDTTPPEDTVYASFWCWSDSSNGAKTYMDDLSFAPVECGGGDENHAPKLKEIKDQKNIVNSDIIILTEASDEDEDELAFSASGLPDGLEIDSIDGTIIGTAIKVDTYHISVTVSDGNGATDSQTFSLDITEAEDTSSCNILQNSDFEKDINGWNVYGDANLVSDSHNGEKAVKIKNGGLDQTSLQISSKPDTYQFNGYYKTTGKTDGIWVGMVFLDSDKNLIHERSFHLKDSDNFTKFILNATSTEDTKYIEAWIWSSAEENSGEIVLDDLKVSRSSCYDYALASSLPPSGLKPSQVPQFVVIGFDDNLKSEGISWALDLFYGKNNKDGSKARVSFYMNTTGLDDWDNDDAQRLLHTVKRLENTSNEVGNHTDNHHSNLDHNNEEEVLLKHQEQLTNVKNDTKDVDDEVTVEKSEEDLFNRIKKLGKSAWEERILAASNDLITLAGVSRNSIKGFRAPYLLFNQHSMSLLKSHDFLYDCSIEEGYAKEFDGTNFRWPYQLNEGSPGHTESWYGNSYNDQQVDIKTIDGLWELPNHVLMIPKNSECSAYGIRSGLWSRLLENIPYLEDYKVTGLDYNLWSEGGVNKAEMLGILKYNLDLRLNGNRAPFMFGAHSQYYTKDWADNHAKNASVDDMREAISEFVDYALSKEDVRIRPGVEIIKWCKNPRAL